ncbi:MAG: branched-chain amino acid ABC transporter permease [Spirochaetales bacterium]|jgi:branched-chain amino acid transport system permease protein|nr:branched-chain amino acid ABC transporter permease [Spirochaetales bacterium]
MRSRRGLTLCVLALLAAVALGLPFLVSGFWVRQFTEIFMYAILASALNIIAGYTGYTAFGNMVFFGMGAYTVAILMTRANFPFAVAFVCAGFISVITAVILGVFLLRLKGQYFALGTTGAMLAVRQIVDIWSDLTGGTQGISVPRLPGTPYFANAFFYFFMLALLLVTVFFVSRLHTNRLGYAFKAIRANEEAANVMGINTTKYKVIAWSLSAFFTGLTGAVYAYWFSYIESKTVFDVLWVTNMFVMIIVGGMGTVLGPVVGAFLLQTVSRYFWSRYMTLHLGILGTIIIFAVLCIPNGILRVRWKGVAGLLAEKLRAVKSASREKEGAGE